MKVTDFSPVTVKGDFGYLPPGERCDCNDLHPELPFLCSRDAGHDGDHAAHGIGNEMFSRWSPGGEA